MTHGTRRSVAAAMMIAAFVAIDRAEGAENNPAAAAAVSAPISRVRSADPAIGTLIRDAAERSRTFRGLLDAIEASDGIVYVSAGRCGDGNARACLVHQVSVAGPNRILKIRVDPDQSDVNLMGSVGHEFRHAIEVLSEPTVTSDVGIMLFYRQHGMLLKGVFETDAAVETGLAVRTELRRTLRDRR